MTRTEPRSTCEPSIPHARSDPNRSSGRPLGAKGASRLFTGSGTLRVGASWLGSAAVGVLLLLFWWACSQVLFVIPDPWASLNAFLRELFHGGLWVDVAFTFRAILISIVLSFLIGLAAGIPLGLNAYSRRVVEPLLLTLNATPKIILFPIVLAIFKIGLASAVVMAVIHGIFPVIINTMSALKDLKPIYLKVARISNASLWQTVFKIYVPSMILPLVTSLRLCFGLCMIGVVLAEIFAAREGLGRVIMHNYTLAKYPEMMGTLVFLYLSGMTGSLLIWKLEKLVRKLM